MKKVLSIILIIVVLAGLVAGICALVHKFKPNTGLAVIRPIQKGDQITGFELNEEELLKLDYEKLIKDIEPQRKDLETDGDYVDCYNLVVLDVEASGVDANSDDPTSTGIISVLKVHQGEKDYIALSVAGRIVRADGELANTEHFESLKNPGYTMVVKDVHNAIKLIGAIKPIYAESK